MAPPQQIQAPQAVAPTPQPQESVSPLSPVPPQGLPSLNNLYKTQLCKHFMQTKHCHVGAKCHFAHGENELRKKDDVSISNLFRPRIS